MLKENVDLNQCDNLKARSSDNLQFQQWISDFQLFKMSWQVCEAYVRDIEISTTGVMFITLQACGKCTECIEYIANFRSRRIVRIVQTNDNNIIYRKINARKMITKLLDLECNLQGQTKAVVLYDQNNSDEHCVVEVEHRLNINRYHSLMCCSKPHRSVKVEDDGRVILSFKACRVCKRCIGNVGNC